MVRVSTLAADIHRRMVNDPRFGYSWSERWGAHPETWDMEGVPVTIQVGDYDCSSSCITAWRLALAAAGYPDALDGATYTGNMRSVFTRSGFFAWVPTTEAQRGDLYLNEKLHVAMCQGKTLSEFRINENGGTYGGSRGDQTGAEAWERGIYSYPWDGCLHCIKDIEIPTEEEDMAITDQDIQSIAAACASYAWGDNDKGANLNMYNCAHWTYWNVVELQTELAALTEAVATLSKSVGADPDKIAGLVASAVERKLESLKVKLQVD